MSDRGPEATSPEPDDRGPATDAAGMPLAADHDEPGATAIIPVDEQATEVIVPADVRREPPAAAPAAVAAAPSPSAATAAPEASAPPRRRNRAARAWIIVGVIVVVLAALVVVADLVVRNVAEARFADEVEANLPDGVGGEVDVTLGGFSVIAQYLSGSMDRVELSAPQLTVDGVPIAVDVVGEGVPVDLAAPVDRMTATVEADAEAINRLIQVQGVEGDLAFGDGTVGYTDSIRFLGLPVEFSVTARPVAAGDTVLLEPEGVEVGALGGSFDASGLVDRILGDDPIPVCVAEHLPQGVEVQQIVVRPDGATVALQADGLRLDEASLATKGSCD